MNPPFFYAWNDDHGAIINEHRENIKLRYEGGVWNNMSEGFETVEELYSNLGILTDMCKNCNRPVLTNYTEPFKSRIKRSNVCFHCIYWLDVIKHFGNDPNLIIIPRGVLYSCHEVLPHNKNYTHKIQKLTGEVVHTSSVWLIGFMPKRFLSLLPINAEILA